MCIIITEIRDILLIPESKREEFIVDALKILNELERQRGKDCFEGNFHIEWRDDQDQSVTLLTNGKLTTINGKL